jgi:hypothetical protein
MKPPDDKRLAAQPTVANPGGLPPRGAAPRPIVRLPAPAPRDGAAEASSGRLRAHLRRIQLGACGSCVAVVRTDRCRLRRPGPAIGNRRVTALRFRKPAIGLALRAKIDAGRARVNAVRSVEADLLVTVANACVAQVLDNESVGVNPPYQLTMSPRPFSAQNCTVLPSGWRLVFLPSASRAVVKPLASWSWNRSLIASSAPSSDG